MFGELVVLLLAESFGNVKTKIGNKLEIFFCRYMIQHWVRTRTNCKIQAFHKISQEIGNFRSFSDLLWHREDSFRLDW